MDISNGLKAEVEIDQTSILVDYLLSNNMDFDNLDNFKDPAVKSACYAQSLNRRSKGLSRQDRRPPKKEPRRR